MTDAFGVPSRLLARAVFAGVLAGAAYAWSPLTVVFLVAMALLLRWTLRDLEGRERRWVAGVLSLAVALRLLAVACLMLYAGVTRSPVASFLGDEFYLKRRVLWLRNLWSDVPIGPLYFSVSSGDYGWTGYHYVLAVLQMLVGASPFGMHLFSIAWFMAGAVLLHRLARGAFGRVAALAGLIVLCFWPTLFVWSVAVLKEPFQLLLTAALLAAAMSFLRARRWPTRVMSAACGAIVVVGLWTLRPGALAGAALGVTGGLVLAAVLSRWELAAMTAAGVTSAAAFLLTHRTWLTPILARLKTAAITHMGHVLTPGHVYKLLDRPLYYVQGVHQLSTMSLAEAARYVIRGVMAFVLVPLPWEMASRAELATLPQQLLWYLLELLALVGVVAGLRRNVLVTSLLVASVVAPAGIIALHDGNVGTLVRHRDAVLPFVVWLSAVGAAAAISRRTRGHEAEAKCR